MTCPLFYGPLRALQPNSGTHFSGPHHRQVRFIRLRPICASGQSMDWKKAYIISGQAIMTSNSLKKGNFSAQLAEAALQQSVVLNAQVTFIWSSIIARGQWKYNQRAYRYVYIDAGHIAQNLYLAGEGLGTGRLRRRGIL